MAPTVMDGVWWFTLDNGRRVPMGGLAGSPLVAEHLPGQHDQESHGGDRAAGVESPRKKNRREFLTPDSDTPDGDDERDKYAKDKATRGPMVAAVRDKEGRWTAPGGKPLPDHVPKAIPPGWDQVEYTTDPDADVVITAVDGKGRGKTVYSDSWEAKAAALKFTRVAELRQKERFVVAQIEKDLSADDHETSEAAHCLRLIQATGLRPGSDSDTGADVQAYGATTLEGRHVVQLKGGVRLRFVGKKGVKLDIPVEDKAVARMLLDRAEKAGRKGRLFDISADNLNEYARTLDGGHFTAKDFRTARGTNVAIREIGTMEPPETEKEYKAAVRKVGDVVAAALGNTRTVALQSYCDPAVFAKWRAGVERKQKAAA